EQAVQLSATISQLTQETQRLQATSTEQINQIAKLRADTELQSAEIGKAKAEAEQKDQEIQKRELLIRNLNMQIEGLKTQLERLIRVDSERRPRPCLSNRHSPSVFRCNFGWRISSPPHVQLSF